MRSIFNNALATPNALLLALVFALALAFGAEPAQAATFIVTKTADTDDGTCDGDCSLREAIAAANGSGGADTIEFTIPGGGVQTITLDQALGTLLVADPVLIDGLSQPGASCDAWPPTLRIKIDGSLFVGLETGILFIVDSSGSEIRGLSITNFPATAIVTNPGASNINAFCNYLGVDPDGITGEGNSTGMALSGNGNRVGGSLLGQRNLISSNSDSGLALQGDGHIVEGNIIGLNATGNTSLPNGEGMNVSGTGNRIGGTVVGSGNLISGNTGNGITVDTATALTIVGNIVGSNSNGTSGMVGNGDWGIDVAFSSSPVQIGGTSVGARNLITANVSGNVRLNNDGSRVEGNFIGTNGAGTASLPGGQTGILINGDNSEIGGTEAAARNVIRRVSVFGDSNRIEGNYICLGADGISPLTSCQLGVELVTGNEGNVIGGALANSRNTILASNIGVLVTNPGLGTEIRNNYIGTDASGTQGLGGVTGVFLANSSSQILVQDNLISSWTTGIGVSFSAATIRGNRIGTDVNGVIAIPNQVGLVLGEGVIEVGGADIGHINLISGNTEAGIRSGFSTGQAILNNFIGTDASGLVPLGNGIGIDIESHGNVTIGSSPSTGNVISGNLQEGVLIRQDGDVLNGTPNIGNFLRHNLIGVGVDGQTPVGNGASGVRLRASLASEGIVSGNVIGHAGAGNVIAANGGPGVLMEGIQAMGNTVQGNFIGTDVSGALPLGNGGDGVRILAGLNNVTGGTALGEGNVIAHNLGQGVLIKLVGAASCTGKSVLGNAIYDNDGLGIDLVPAISSDGLVTPNDAGDLDSTAGGNGPNDLQNFPVLTAATAMNGTTAIQGFLDSLPNVTYRVELFENEFCDASGYGEAQRFLGTADITTDALGQAVLDLNLPLVVTPGRSVVATATDPQGSTSEISACVAVAGLAVVEVPTLGPVGIVVLALFLALAGLVMRRRSLPDGVMQEIGRGGE